MTVQELGQQTKRKYPQYNNLSDDQVGSLVLQKYPQYQAQIDQSPKGQTGLTGFGVGAGKGIFSTLTGSSSLGERVLRGTVGQIPRLFGGVGQKQPERTSAERIVPEGLRVPQGTAENIGFGAEQVGEFLVPGGASLKLSKAVSTIPLLAKAPRLIRAATTLGTRAVAEAGLVGGQTAIQKGKVDQQVGLSAAIAGGLPIVSQTIGSLINKAPKTAWSAILKRTPIEAAKKPLLPEQAAKTGLFGATREGILGKTKQEIQKIEVALDDILSQSKEKIGTLKIAPYLDELRKAYQNVPGEDGAVKIINNTMKSLLKKKSITALEANQIKRSIYSVIDKSYGKGLLEAPAKTEAQKMIARGLKQEIEKIIPEVKGLNERQAIYIQIKKALDKTIARGEGKGIAGTGVGLYDFLAGGIGALAGATSGQPILGALGFAAGKRIAESVTVLSGVAKMAKYFDTLSPTKKILFYNAIKGLTTQTPRLFSGQYQSQKDSKQE